MARRARRIAVSAEARRRRALELTPGVTQVSGSRVPRDQLNKAEAEWRVDVTPAVEPAPEPTDLELDTHLQVLSREPISLGGACRALLCYLCELSGCTHGCHGGKVTPAGEGELQEK
ncbi:MAG: hypothetical protein O7H41_08435 [Planctomycetota bacterium]|nr:hypothetical protein [Planctomycetota bacterium]